MLHKETVSNTTLELLPPPVKMANGKPLDWKRIEKRLIAMEKSPSKVFEAL